MISTTVPSGDSRRADGSNDLTSEGNADTTAVDGASGTDITASTEYGSKKSPDGAEDVRHFTWHMQALYSTVKQCCMRSVHISRPAPMLLTSENHSHSVPTFIPPIVPHAGTSLPMEGWQITKRHQTHITRSPICYCLCCYMCRLI